MNERQNKILKELYSIKDGKRTTSSYIAKKFNVSVRTVKSDIYSINDDIQSNGAVINAKRNQGYKLVITDDEIFTKFYIKVTLSNGEYLQHRNDKSEIRLTIARRIVASENGIKIDELAEELGFSRNALNEFLRWSDGFFKSYNLENVSSSKIGKKVIGQEYSIRLAISELVATHYHNIDLYNEGEIEFSKWVGDNEKERADVRHIFLKILRNSNFDIRDSNSQRMAIYLVLAKKRFDAGYKIEISEKWIKLVKSTSAYNLIDKIFIALTDYYGDDYLNDEEKAMCTCIFLSYLSVNANRWDFSIYKQIKKSLKNAMQEVNNVLEKLCIKLNDLQLQALENLLVPIVYATKFAMDGQDKFGYSFENIYLADPVDLYCAYQISEALAKSLGYKSSKTDLAIFGCFVQSVIETTEYPIKKLRLLSTGSFGPYFGYCHNLKYLQKYDNLIECIDPIELYEYRRIEDENIEYDGFLLDNTFGNGEASEKSGYNYNLPAIESSVSLSNKDEINAYNNLLIKAFQFDEYLFDSSKISVIEDYQFYSIEQTFQLLAMIHAKNSMSITLMQMQFLKHDSMKSMVFNNTVVIIDDGINSKEEVFELYFLANPGYWKGRKFEQLIFISTKIESIYKLKALQTIVKGLVDNPEEFLLFKQDYKMSMEHLVRVSLRK